VHPRLAEDLAELPELLEQTRALAGQILTGLADRPVATTLAAPAESAALPLEGAGLRAALEEFRRRWEPGFSGSAGPRYLGFVTGGATPAAVAGDWLTGILDQNASGRVGSGAADLERETLRWLAELFGIGAAHTGAFVSGATMSNVAGLAIARESVGEQLGVSVTDDGVGALGAVTVLSGTPHSSVLKALSVLGIGRSRLRTVPTLPDREAVDTARLADALAALNGRPAIVVANAGTVNTGDFDDLREIVALRRHHPFWLHVDAAFGGFAALSPEHADLVSDLDGADSVCVDLHKWLNVPYDSAVQFSRRQDLQFRVFHNAAAYLSPSADVPDYLHLTPENSRRLRALAAWFALAAYGRDGHREIVVRNIALARELGERIAASARWRLLAPVRLNVVCFTVAANPTMPRIQDIAGSVAAGGETFLTPTVLSGVPALRAAFSNWRTTGADVDRVFQAITAAEDTDPER
jgi:glutamate/tyrosine decarboxylase-like PLP-dependent enzyme